MAIGLGLAAAYYAGSLWFQVFISRHASTLAPALMVAGFVVRLMVLAAVVIPLALYTDLNIVALLVAFLVLFTLTSVWGIYHQVKRAKVADGSSTETTGTSATGTRAAKGSKGA